MKRNENKWAWKMDYCASNNLIPTLKESWDEAELEYQEMFRNYRSLGS
jgi:hypothetical protein